MSGRVSAKIVLPDSSGIKHHEKDARRQYMIKVFKQLGLWDGLNNRPTVDKARERSEELVFEFLDKQGWHNISEPFFEYAVDKTLWRVVIIHGGFAEIPWPWGSNDQPKGTKLELRVSQIYKRWRLSYGKSIEERPGRENRAHRFVEKPKTESKSPAAPRATKPPTGPAVRETVVEDKALKKKRVTEKRLLQTFDVRRAVAKAIFDGEVGRIIAKEARAAHNGSNNGFRGRSCTDEVDESAAHLTLPVRDVFVARSGETVEECTLPPHDVLQEMWESSVKLDFNDCFTGPFEIAIPPWFDFHDMVLDGLHRIKDNRLIDQDLVLAWRTRNGHPVSLIVSPRPNLFNDEEIRHKERQDRTRVIRVRRVWYQVAEWLNDVYRGNPTCLADFLQAKVAVVLHRGSAWLEFAGSITKLQDKWDEIKDNPAKASSVAKWERGDWDIWMPEIYAYMSRPNGPDPAMLKDWVMRETGAFHQRLTIATAVWSNLAANEALDWYEQALDNVST